MSTSEEVNNIETKLQEVNIESKENAKPEENIGTNALKDTDLKMENPKSKNKKKKKKKADDDKKDIVDEEAVDNKENDENEPVVENIVSISGISTIIMISLFVLAKIINGD